LQSVFAIKIAHIEVHSQTAEKNAHQSKLLLVFADIEGALVEPGGVARVLYALDELS
jgi:hypothetical protein